MKETKFKQTEIGEIPVDWEVKELGNISFVTKLAGFEFTAHVKYSDEGNIIALRGLNVRKGFLSLEEVKYIDNSNFSKLNRSKLFKDDLLFTYVGTVGNVALVDKDDCYYLAPNVALIRMKQGINSAYIMYLLLSDYFFNRQIKMLMSTTSQAALSMTNIRLFQIPLPPTLAEQQRIAKALGDVDTAIATLEKLIQKKKNVKQGAMQLLLTGKKRLPGFAKSTGCKHTELGEIPEDWEVVNFESLFNICTATIATSDINCEYYIGTENMLQNKMGITKNEQSISATNVREYKENDILVSNIRPYLKKIWLASLNGGCSTDVLVFRRKTAEDAPLFLYYLIASDRFFQIVNDNAVGTKMPRGDKTIIKKILFPLPSKSEQSAIAKVLSDMDKEIDGLNKKLQKYRQLKTAMMQQLLTGKIRLV